MKNIEQILNRDVPFNAPRGDVVAYVRDVARLAREMSLSQLTEAGDFSDPNVRYPSTLGERIANDVSYVLLIQDWLEDNPNDVLNEILEVFSQLDKSVSDADDWKRFFQLAERLS